MTAVVGAVPAREGELVGRRRAGDHPRAHQLADLDRREPDAAGGAEHRERLAGAQLRAVLQRIERGAVGDDQAGGALEVEPVRQLHQPVGRDRDLLARRAVADVGRARGRPAARRSRPAPTLSTSPANSAAGENGKAGLVWYLPAMISVSKKLSAAARTAHHRLAVGRHRIGQIADLELIGPAVAGAENGFHRAVIARRAELGGRSAPR